MPQLGTKMTSFLITFKPATENKKQGWPIEEFRKLVAQVRNSGSAEADWRFKNQKDGVSGDQVFLLVQGKLGPAIIGHGEIVKAGRRDGLGVPRTPIRFDHLVDPTKKVFIGRYALLAYCNSSAQWHGTGRRR